MKAAPSKAMQDKLSKKKSPKKMMFGGKGKGKKPAFSLFKKQSAPMEEDTDMDGM